MVACIVAALVAAMLPGSAAFGEAQKYLIVSAASTGHIAYLKLPHSGAPAVSDGQAMKSLVTDGLVFPQGIAVDEYRQRLFVADTNQSGIVMYDLSANGDALSVGTKKTVASGVQVRAVAVDGLGNIVFTDEANNRILKVTNEMIAAGQTTPIVLYSGNNSVQAPGGVAIDNYFVYWLNKQNGTQAGTLFRGQQTTASASSVSMLATNPKCYGLCIAAGNLFFTDASQNLYGINRASTSRHRTYTISSSFQEPRGCVYDGSSTVYVADKAKNAVYQFAANMEPLETQQMTKAVDLEGAYGVAIYTDVS